MSTHITTTPEIDSLIRANSPVAIGVSGGKDSDAAAFATVDYLDRLGHTGPRVLIHSDLGRVAQALGLTIDYTEAGVIRARYAELMTQAGYPLLEYRGPAVLQQSAMFV